LVTDKLVGRLLDDPLRYVPAQDVPLPPPRWPLSAALDVEYDLDEVRTCDGARVADLQGIHSRIGAGCSRLSPHSRRRQLRNTHAQTLT
jgi:hypothetical protein